MSLNTLTQELSGVAGIVGKLGISIATAQKLFNKSYLDGLATTVAIIQTIKNSKNDTTTEQDLQTIIGAIKDIAPARYQYTQTELEFHADLSQSLDISGSASVGISLNAVTINAAISGAFAQDYRAAARIKTTIQAISPNVDMIDYLNRLPANSAPQLPEDTAEIDREIVSSVGVLMKNTVDMKPADTTGKTEFQKLVDQ